MNRYGCFLIVCLLLVLQSGCGTTVQPGQRGLRWYPFTEGLTTNTLKSGFYWRAPWNDVFTYDVRWQSYVESVDALSSDDLLVKLRAAIIMKALGHSTTIHRLGHQAENGGAPLSWESMPTSSMPRAVVRVN